MNDKIDEIKQLLATRVDELEASLINYFTAAEFENVEEMIAAKPPEFYRQMGRVVAIRTKELYLCKRHLAEKEAEIIRLDDLLAEASRELDRYRNREGKPSIQLLLPYPDDPFNRIDLKIVDFGVADNLYVTESDEIERLSARLAEARECYEKWKDSESVRVIAIREFILDLWQVIKKIGEGKE